MKTLYIVRHAKALIDFEGFADIDRPLVDEGINNTNKISFELKNRNVNIDLLISSHAKRAFETAKIIAGGIKYPIENIEINKNIYNSGEDEIFDIIFAVDKSIESLMIVGHNPTFTHLANLFLENKIEHLPTSCLVSVSFNTDRWDTIYKAPRTTNFILLTKMLNKRH
ncbi:MAG: histidine phosphatase family protein [Bacteroidetes bacterium]|nr:histidine phosphatase family protein [Bacteroidota bacterium]